MPESTRLLRQLTGRDHALLAGRGAAGIWAALRALGLRDQTVLIPANTCYIVLWAVLRSGNKPLLVDVDAATGNVGPSALSLICDGCAQQSAKDKDFHHRDTEDAERKHDPHPPAAFASPLHREGEKPAAIIPCHMYGLPAPMEAICAWARANGVYVIEDAALASGALVGGQPAGSWGDVSVFSFGLGKIADNGLGGAVMTDDPALAADIGKLLAETPIWDDRLMAITNQWNAIYWALHQHEAHNPRLPALYPALYDIYGDLTAYQLPASYWDDLPGLLQALPAHRAHRAAWAATYDDLLRQTPLATLPRPDGTMLWRYPLRVGAGRRDDLLQYLWDNGLHGATRWYPPLRYMTAALAPEVEQPATPNTDGLGESIINLRLDPAVNQAYVERTIRLIRAYFSENPTTHS